MKAHTDNGRRTCRKEIQFSDEEMSEVRRKAQSANLSPAVFIREAALGKEVKEVISDDDRAMWRRAAEVSRGLQINLNQMAHRANIEGLRPLAEANKELIARIDRSVQVRGSRSTSTTSNASRLPLPGWRRRYADCANR